MGIFFSFGFEDDTVKLFVDDEILIDTILSTNYATGKAYLSSIKRPSKTQNLTLNINGQLKLVKGPFDSLKVHISYLDREISYKHSSKKLVLY